MIHEHVQPLYNFFTAFFSLFYSFSTTLQNWLVTLVAATWEARKGYHNGLLLDLSH